jgi:hypothetical protein
MQWQAGAIYVADLVNGARSGECAEGVIDPRVGRNITKIYHFRLSMVFLPVLAGDPKQRRADIPLAKSAMEGPARSVGWD